MSAISKASLLTPSPLPAAAEPVANRSPHSQCQRVEEWKRTVRGYYNAKTAALIDKYGPGPRVHYHLGLFGSDPAPVLDVETMRRRLVEGQETLVHRAAEAWQAPFTMRGRVLDVGCGLGGGSIFWAQHYGADVTAVTVAEDHITPIREFSAQAGVERQIHPLVAEACGVPIGQRYDSAVAIESSCYFDRRRWFQHLSRLISMGGYVCIEDVFRTSPGGTKLWDSHFHARAESVRDYVTYARAAGFELDVNVDVTAETPPFWRQSQGWIDAKLASPELDDATRQRLLKSRRIHEGLYREWVSGGLEVRLLRFRRTDEHSSDRG